MKKTTHAERKRTKDARIAALREALGFDEEGIDMTRDGLIYAEIATLILGGISREYLHEIIEPETCESGYLGDIPTYDPREILLLKYALELNDTAFLKRQQERNGHIRLRRDKERALFEANGFLINERREKEAERVQQIWNNYLADLYGTLLSDEVKCVRVSIYLCDRLRRTLPLLARRDVEALSRHSIPDGCLIQKHSGNSCTRRSCLMDLKHALLQTAKVYLEQCGGTSA